MHKEQEAPQSCWGLILSRQGSRRLPGKATRLLGEKPLIAYTFEACREAASLSRRWVFSDDPEVLQLAPSYGLELPPFQRPLVCSQAETTTEETLRYFLAQFPPEALPSLMVLLQPTSPFRTASDIDHAIALFQQQPCDGVMSVTLPEKPTDWLYEKDEQGFLRPLFKQFRPALLPNGAIYLFQPQRILAGASLDSGNILPYEMPRDRSIDIDTADDFQWAAWRQSLQDI